MANKRKLTSRAVSDRYGGRSARSLYRWVRSGILPEPERIAGHHFWDEDELDRRDEERKAAARAATYGDAR